MDAFILSCKAAVFFVGLLVLFVLFIVEPTLHKFRNSFTIH